MEAIGQLLDHLGYATPLLYASASYGLFHWLDETLSNEAKAALARTMNLKSYGKEQVASALVEVFDRIYTSPLLSWRAFFRSWLFTSVVTLIYVFEFLDLHWGHGGVREWSLIFLFNVLTDYFCLFVIRASLSRSSTTPVIGLLVGTLSAVAIVELGNALRDVALTIFHIGLHYWLKHFTLGLSLELNYYMWPALAVFAWLPLFALGILAIRVLPLLSWIVEKAQWAVKEGDLHPLRAIGFVAAVAVFAVAAGLQTMIAE